MCWNGGNIYYNSGTLRFLSGGVRLVSPSVLLPAIVYVLFHKTRIVPNRIVEHPEDLGFDSAASDAHAREVRHVEDQKCGLNIYLVIQPELVITCWVLGTGQVSWVSRSQLLPSGTSRISKRQAQDA